MEKFSNIPKKHVNVRFTFKHIIFHLLTVNGLRSGTKFY